MVKEIGKDSSSYLLLLVWELRNGGAPLDDDLESTDRGKGEEVCPGKVGPTLRATLAMKGLNTTKVGNMIQIMPRVGSTGSESDIMSPLVRSQGGIGGVLALCFALAASIHDFMGQPA